MGSRFCCFVDEGAGHGMVDESYNGLLLLF